MNSITDSDSESTFDCDEAEQLLYELHDECEAASHQLNHSFSQIFDHLSSQANASRHLIADFYKTDSPLSYDQIYSEAISQLRQMTTYVQSQSFNLFEKGFKLGEAQFRNDLVSQIANPVTQSHDNTGGRQQQKQHQNRWNSPVDYTELRDWLCSSCHGALKSYFESPKSLPACNAVSSSSCLVASSSDVAAITNEASHDATDPLSLIGIPHISDSQLVISSADERGGEGSGEGKREAEVGGREVDGAACEGGATQSSRKRSYLHLIQQVNSDLVAADSEPSKKPSCSSPPSPRSLNSSPPSPSSSSQHSVKPSRKLPRLE